MKQAIQKTKGFFVFVILVLPVVSFAATRKDDGDSCGLEFDLALKICELNFDHSRECLKEFHDCLLQARVAFYLCKIDGVLKEMRSPCRHFISE